MRCSTLIRVLLLLAFGAFGQVSHGQEASKKVEFTGLGRAYYTSSRLSGSALDGDTATPRIDDGGYTLLDLGVTIRPSKAVQIQSLIRMRNEFGGFFGGGVSVLLRQLTLQGVVAERVRYQLGDIYLKQSRYTLWNETEEGYTQEADAFMMQREVVRYENFYNGNNWRLQGAQAEFALEADKVIEQLSFSAYAARNRPGNLLTLPDRYLTGASLRAWQSKYLVLAAHYAGLTDLRNSTSSQLAYANRTLTTQADLALPIGAAALKLTSEAGISSANYAGYDKAPPTRQGNFYDLAGSLGNAGKGWNLSLGYRSVSPYFSSPGAQTKRIQFQNKPGIFSSLGERYPTRPANGLDLVRDDALYNQAIQAQLQVANPLFANGLPYGTATPNRRGLNATAEAKKDWGQANAQISLLSEITGTGTRQLRKFVTVGAGSLLQANQLLKWKRSVKLNLGARFEQTNRGGNALEQVALTTYLVDAGLSLETLKGLEVLLGWKLINGYGNENDEQRNAYNRIIDLKPVAYNVNQNLYAAGMRYGFGKGISLSVLGQGIGQTTSNSASPSYGMQQLVILFTMQL